MSIFSKQIIKMSMIMMLTRAFCLGVDRQHRTEAQASARFKKFFSSLLSSAKAKDSPSTTKPNSIGHSLGESTWRFPSSNCFLTLWKEAWHDKIFQTLQNLKDKLTHFLESYTLEIAAMSPCLSRALISGKSSVMIISFIRCLSRLQAYL